MFDVWQKSIAYDELERSIRIRQGQDVSNTEGTATLMNEICNPRLTNIRTPQNSNPVLVLY
jgi:hypothetical protein